MPKIDLPDGWVHQAYCFEVDRPTSTPAISSHQGARRYAWNWGLNLVEEQSMARGAYRLLALRQGASMSEADQWAKTMVPVPWTKEALRRTWNEAKDLACAKSEDEAGQAADDIAARKVLMGLATRQGASRTEARDFAYMVVPQTGWWQQNSKEACSSAFEALGQAFKNYFDALSGKRKGAGVGWPRYKSRRGRQSVSFTTGVIKVLDRHHVQVPVVGTLRVKEPTDKLRLRLASGTARVLRATLVTGGGRTNVSFSVIAERDAEPVKTFETKSQDFFCRSLWTVGLLIQATVGSLGGEGRRPQKRRGLAA
ncbi:MAG: hypothetical protein ACYDH5_11445 [Acidimicrobiales bacterium]